MVIRLFRLITTSNQLSGLICLDTIMLALIPHLLVIITPLSTKMPQTDNPQKYNKIQIYKSKREIRSFMATK